MAQTPQIEPGEVVAPSNNSLPEFNPAVPAAAFGAPVGAAVSQIGQDAGQEALRMQSLQNETDATNLSAQYMADLGSLKGDYYQKKGQAAVDAAPQYQSDLLGLRQNYLALAGNPAVRQMLSQDVQRQTSYSLVELGEHVPQQMNLASIQASQSRIESAATAAVGVRNDPNQVAEYVARQVSEVRKIGQINGWDADTVKAKAQNVVGGTYGSVIRALAVDNPNAAMALFNQARGYMDADSQVKIAEFLQPKYTADKLATGADAIFGGAQPNTGPANVVPADARPAMLEKATAGTGVPPYLLDAVVQRESGWNTNANSGVALGLGQVKPSTARQPGYGVNGIDPGTLTDGPTNLAFSAQYLAGLGKKFGVTDWNNPDQARQVLEAYNGSNTKSQYANEVLAIAAGGNPGAPRAAQPGAPASFPDLDTMLEKGRAYVASDPSLAADPLAADKMDAMITRRYHMLSTEVQSQRTAFELQNKDNEALLAAGDPRGYVPAAEYSRLYPPDVAAQKTQSDTELQQDGLTVQKVRLAAPADVQALLAKLNPGNDPAIEGYATKSRQYSVALRAVTERDSQLTKDGAAYVINNIPSVNAAWTAFSANPSDPAATAAYVTQTKAQLARLGVQPSQMNVFPLPYAEAQVKRIETLDPKEADIPTEFAALKKQYGDNYGDLLQSMRRAGLNPQYGIAATLNAPGQVGVAQDATRMMSFLATKGGEKGLETTAGTTYVKAIDTALADPGGPLSEFRATTTLTSKGLEDNVNVSTFVRNLAMYYAATRQAPDGTAAAQMAVDNVLGKQYDFVDTARVEKDRADEFTSAQQSVKDGLSTDTVGLPPNYANRPFLRDMDEASMVRAAKAGLWATNPDGKGVTLMAALPNGGYIPAYGKNGQPITMMFSDMKGINSKAAQVNMLARIPDGPQ